MFIDVLYRTLYVAGKPVKVPPGPMKLLLRLLLAAPKPVSHKAVQAALDASGAGTEATSTAALKELAKGLKGALELAAKASAKGVTATVPETLTLLVPVWLAHASLTDSEKAILKLLRKRGSASMIAIQDLCELSRAAARRDVAALTKAKLVEPAREGRGQVYRLV
jgi:DNA-binding transcriptional ArsR family regulator